MLLNIVKIKCKLVWGSVKLDWMRVLVGTLSLEQLRGTRG